MPYSAVVVGGGVVGYSTALALQRCGEETVLLEQVRSCMGRLVMLGDVIGAVPCNAMYCQTMDSSAVM